MIKEIIKKFNMQAHPEGGHFTETYRSNELVEMPNGSRNISTAIYFLLQDEEISHLHRIKSDEMWHFYLGEPLLIFEIDENGQYHETILGPNILEGQKVQYTVRAGRWFGSTPLNASTFSFVGCTVSPGFDFKDFELMNEEIALKEYKHLYQKIEKYIIK
jgi:predicted cupin superfamily sugar epimerase